MKLQDALDIGEACGLETVGDAILNIQMKAGQIFDYNQAQDEIDKLCVNFKNSGFSLDDKISARIVK